MIEIILPALGEGIIEAEITRWLVREGMHVETDEPLVEVATDKVDTEIPAPGSGTIHKILLKEGDTAKIGQVLAIIASPGDKTVHAEPEESGQAEAVEAQKEIYVEPVPSPTGERTSPGASTPGSAGQEATGEPAPPLTARVYKKVAFLSPVIRKIAVENGLSPAEIEGIKGSATGGRITKADLLQYLARKPKSGPDVSDDDAKVSRPVTGPPGTIGTPHKSPPKEETQGKEPLEDFLTREQIYGNGPTTVEEMDRMRKRIADHMVYSKRVAPHVTSFVECDVTEMVRWRERVKDAFQKKYNQRLTITTLILEAVIKSLKQHPRINVSINRYDIILKQEINLGMATALPDGNLIVPVIHVADKLNLVGLAARVNDLADRARTNKLQLSQIQGGTFTVTNLGQFGNISGTPIINQPQVAILAVGAIVKKPAIVETEEGDTIGIRHILVLSLAYDHRVVDGALGGTFLKSIGDHLQNFDPARAI